MPTPFRTIALSALLCLATGSGTALAAGAKPTTPACTPILPPDCTPTKTPARTPIRAPTKTLAKAPAYTPPPPATAPSSIDPSYGDIVLLKLGSGLANMATGVVEIPKNIINTANGGGSGSQSVYSGTGSTYSRGGEVLFGITGGALKGALHTVGRTLSGLLDFTTCFIPTRPIPRPGFVWENFQNDTQYGPILRVDSQTPTPQPGRMNPPAR